MDLGIDVHTKDKNKLIARLEKLKTTESVCDGGMYHEDNNCSQIHITTSWNESELDDWLYKTKGMDYLGTFSREPNRERQA